MDVAVFNHQNSLLVRAWIDFLYKVIESTQPIMINISSRANAFPWPLGSEFSVNIKPGPCKLAQKYQWLPK
jgi:hypothetical protein